MRDRTRIVKAKTAIGTGVVACSLMAATIMPAVAATQFKDPFGSMTLTPTTFVKSASYELAGGNYGITPKFDANNVTTSGYYYTGFTAKNGDGTYSIEKTANAFVSKYVTTRTYKFDVTGNKYRKVFLTGSTAKAKLNRVVLILNSLS